MPTTPTSSSPQRTPRRLRRALPYLGAVLLLALIVAGLWPRPAGVETTVATIGPLRSTIDEEGRTRIRQRFTVSAPVAGVLRRIPLKSGAEVQSNVTVVAVLDPLPPALLDARARSLAEARRDTATAQLGKAQVSRDFAATELRRVSRLRTEGSASAQELETASMRDAAAVRDLAAAESALRQVEAELAETAPTANAGLSPTEVRSPATGRVLRVFEESSRAVATGTPLLEVGDPTDLEVVIETLSRDGASIAPGTPVELEHWGGTRPLQARVRLVEPAAFTKVSALGVEEQRVNVIADLVTPPAERPGLGDRFRVEARIITWEDARALQIASGALFRHGNGWGAFVIEGGHARLREVTLGRAGRTETQITAGLREGERAVLYPGDRVHDGLSVRPIQIAR